MNPNLNTLPAYGAGVSPDRLILGVPTKLLIIQPRDGDVNGQVVKGSGLYVGRSNGSLKDEVGHRSIVWKGSGAVWEHEEDRPTHMGREAIAGTVVLGDGRREHTLVGQRSGDGSQILRVETGIELPPRATEVQRKEALRNFMRKHGAAPEPHGAFPLAPEVLELSSRETGESDTQADAGEAVRLSSAVDGHITTTSGVSWGRRSLFLLPKGAGILIKGAVPGVLFRVVNVGEQLEFKDPAANDLALWHQLEGDRLQKRRKKA